MPPPVCLRGLPALSGEMFLRTVAGLVCAYKPLFFAVSDSSGHTGESRGITVLFIDGDAVIFKKLIELIHTGFVLDLVFSIYMNYGVDALATTVNHSCYGKIVLTVYTLLFL